MKYEVENSIDEFIDEFEKSEEINLRSSTKEIIRSAIIAWVEYWDAEVKRKNARERLKCLKQEDEE